MERSKSNRGKSMRDSLNGILMAGDAPPKVETAKPDPHGSVRFSLQPMNLRRRFKGRRRRIYGGVVAPRLNERGNQSNLRRVERRRKRRERERTAA